MTKICYDSKCIGHRYFRIEIKKSKNSLVTGSTKFDPLDLIYLFRVRTQNPGYLAVGLRNAEKSMFLNMRRQYGHPFLSRGFKTIRIMYRQNYNIKQNFVFFTIVSVVLLITPALI